VGGVNRWYVPFVEMLLLDDWVGLREGVKGGGGVNGVVCCESLVFAVVLFGDCVRD
jgi:hypothetical protein